MKNKKNLSHPDPKKRKSEDVRQMFDRIAPSYDFLNALLSFQVEKRWRKKAVARMEKRHFALVLDVATGTGPFAWQTLKKAQKTQCPSKVVGLDFSMPMLLHGIKNQQKLRASIIDSYDITQGDAQNLPFSDNIFSAVTIGFGIRNVEDIDLALAETYRVLMPGGVLLILEFSEAIHPVVRGIYNFYFRKILPLLGGWISKEKGAYKYLPRSVTDFPEPSVFGKKMKQVGFQKIVWEKLTFGIVTLYQGYKSIESNKDAM